MPIVVLDIIADNFIMEGVPNDNAGDSILVKMRSAGSGIIGHMTFGGDLIPLTSTINSATIDFEVITKTSTGTVRMSDTKQGTFGVANELTETWNNTTIVRGTAASDFTMAGPGTYSEDCTVTVQGWSDGGLVPYTFSFIKFDGGVVIDIDSIQGTGVDASITIDFTPPVPPPPGVKRRSRLYKARGSRESLITPSGSRLYLPSGSKKVIH